MKRYIVRLTEDERERLIALITKGKKSSAYKIRYANILLKADADGAARTAGITFRPTRKKNSLRATGSYIERKAHRTFGKRIETAFGKITALFPKTVHAVTAKGFELKVISFIMQQVSDIGGKLG